eukprot:snap_masked-scaffold_3-processed-gene-2.41-mRNA-1 protein AED:1.00 eAED:1.00 QI:0/-1/0/0/-1/1/1/0/175
MSNDLNSEMRNDIPSSFPEVEALSLEEVSSREQNLPSFVSSLEYVRNQETLLTDLRKNNADSASNNIRLNKTLEKENQNLSALAETFQTFSNKLSQLKSTSNSGSSSVSLTKNKVVEELTRLTEESERTSEDIFSDFLSSAEPDIKSFLAKYLIERERFHENAAKLYLLKKKASG